MDKKIKFSTKNIKIKWVMALLLGFVPLITYAAPSVADRFTLQNLSAQVSPLAFCSQDYNLLEKEVSYTRADIVGALPYVRKYTSALRLDATHGLDPIVRYRSNLGWTDNYQNSLIVSKSGVKDTSKAVMALRLPGSREPIFYFGKEGAGNISRIVIPPFSA